MYFLTRDDGRRIDARFDLDTSVENPSISIESRSGTGGAGEAGPRNPDYNILLEAILERLAARGILVTRIALESKPFSHLPIAERTLRLEQAYPVDLRQVDIGRFRRGVGSSMSTMHQAPDARRPGNSNRRIRIYLSRPVAAADLLAWEWSPHTPVESSGTAGDTIGVGESPPPAGLEGALRRRLARHRKREKRLRAFKIREHLAQGKRLACEVPGCGFDFEETYGELGKNYAHVHHLKPLGSRGGDEVTRLEDLAVVCANCHAMIHRGRECRPLAGLVRPEA
jgi:hypothetical protein